MKTRICVMILLLALLLAACQPSPAPATQEAGPEEPAPQEKSPEEASIYPEPEVQNEGALPYPDPSSELSVGPYPGPGGSEMVEWQAAVDLINGGQVVSVMQSHDLTVSLTLVDGRTVVTTEPAIDEVMTVIEQCGDVCSNIQVATE